MCTLRDQRGFSIYPKYDNFDAGVVQNLHNKLHIKVKGNCKKSVPTT